MLKHIQEKNRNENFAESWFKTIPSLFITILSKILDWRHFIIFSIEFFIKIRLLSPLFYFINREKQVRYTKFKKFNHKISRSCQLLRGCPKDHHVLTIANQLNCLKFPILLQLLVTLLSAKFHPKWHLTNCLILRSTDMIVRSDFGENRGKKGSNLHQC